MDSLAYSIMLEIKTNQVGLHKSLNKSLKQTTDYHKQMQDSYSATNKDVRRYVDHHRAANKVLKKQVTIWGKIGAAIGAILGKIGAVIGAIAKAIVSVITGGLSIIGDILGAMWSGIKKVAKAVYDVTLSVITGITNMISKHISEMRKLYSEMVDEFRYANFQAAGGVDLLFDSMTDLMMTLGVTAGEAKKTSVAMVRLGFSAKDGAKEFVSINRTINQFERMTGVSAETSAGLAKGLKGLGFSADRTHKIFAGLLGSMVRGRLTVKEMTDLVTNLRQEMFQLEFAFGTESIEKYSQTLGELAGVAKMAGVRVSTVTKLMSELNRDPMKFVVALGSRAFYKSAGENVDALIDKLGEMKDTLEGVQPGLKPGLLKDIYNIDTETYKMLQNVKKFRQQFPAIVKLGKLWNETWHGANKSITRMFTMFSNKILGIFNLIAKKLVKLGIKIVDALTHGIADKIQNLTGVIIQLMNRIFDVDLLGEWGNTAVTWADQINQKLGNLIDTTTRWVGMFAKSEAVYQLRATFQDIYKIINETIIPAIKDMYKWIREKVGKAIKWVSNTFHELVEGDGFDRLRKRVNDFFHSILNPLKDMQRTMLSMSILWYRLSAFKDRHLYRLDKAYTLDLTANKLERELAALEKNPKPKLPSKPKPKLPSKPKSGLKSGVAVPTKKRSPFPPFLHLLDGLTGVGGAINKGVKNLSKIADKTKIATTDIRNKYVKDQKAKIAHRDRLDENLGSIGRMYQDVSGAMREIGIEKAVMNELYARTREAEGRGEKIDRGAELNKIWFKAGEKVSSRFKEIYNSLYNTGLYADQELKVRETSLKKLTYKLSKMNTEEVDQWIKSANKNRTMVGENTARLIKADTRILSMLRANADKQLRTLAAHMQIPYSTFMKNINKQLLREDEIRASARARLRARARAEGVVIETFDKVVEKSLEKVGNILGFHRTGAVLTKASEIPAGAASGVKSEHVATAPVESELSGLTIKLSDEETLGNLGKLGDKQVDLLASIDAKIGQGMYNRNNPSYHEVTSSTWT